MNTFEIGDIIDLKDGDDMHDVLLITNINLKPKNEHEKPYYDIIVLYTTMYTDANDPSIAIEIAERDYERIA